MKNKKKQTKKMTVKDLLKQIHEIDKNITYGGMNAKEIENFKEIPHKQWKKIKEDYNNWLKLNLLSARGLTIILILFSLAFFYFSGWPKTLSAIIAILSLVEIVKREGHREGYMDGYESGFDEGINKTLGIDDKTATNLAQNAIEMELNESIINNLEKK